MPVTETKGRDEITIITVSVTLSAFVIITVVEIISGVILYFALVQRKQNQKANQDSKEQTTDTDGPLRFEIELQDKMKFEASGTKTPVAENEGKSMENND